MAYLPNFGMYANLLLGVYLKFLIFNMPNALNKDVLSIHKRLWRSAISKRNKELQHVLKQLSNYDNFLSKQLSTVYLHIVQKSTVLYNTKSLQKSLYTQHLRSKPL